MPKIDPYATISSETPPEDAMKDVPFWERRKVRSLLSKNEVESRLEAFYTERCPSKLDSLPKLLKRYQGREDALLKAVEAKYDLPDGFLRTTAA